MPKLTPPTLDAAHKMSVITQDGEPATDGMQIANDMLSDTVMRLNETAVEAQTQLEMALEQINELSIRNELLARKLATREKEVENLEYTATVLNIKLQASEAANKIKENATA